MPYSLFTLVLVSLHVTSLTFAAPASRPTPDAPAVAEEPSQHPRPASEPGLVSAAGKRPVTRTDRPTLGTAMLLSFGATFGTVGLGIGSIALGFSDLEVRPLGPLGLALVGLGVSLGPSVGYFYAGAWKRGLVDFGIRSVLYVAGGLMTLNGFESVISDNEGAGWLIAGIATLVVTGVYGIYSCIDAGFAAKRAKAERSASLAFSPTLSRAATGEPQYGLAIVGAF